MSASRGTVWRVSRSSSAMTQGLSREKMAFTKKRGTRSLPITSDMWLDEILRAWNDATHAKPFGLPVGTLLTDKELFQIAPIECLKFRGRDQTGPEADRVRRVALAQYVVNDDQTAPVYHIAAGSPKLTFAVCYMAAHRALDLVDEETIGRVLEYCGEGLVG